MKICGLRGPQTSGRYHHMFFLDHWKCALNARISFALSRQVTWKLSKTMLSFPLFIIGIGSSWLNMKKHTKM